MATPNPGKKGGAQPDAILKKLKNKPKDPWLNAQMARIHDKNGDTSDAVVRAMLSLDKKPTLDNIRLTLRLLTKARAFRAVVLYGEWAVESGLANTQVYAALAKAFDHLKEPDKAEFYSSLAEETAADKPSDTIS